MYCVIALEDWRAKNIIRTIKTYEQKQALWAVLSFAYIKNIILTTDNNPLLLKHEVEVGKICVTFRKDKSFVELVVVTTHIFENVLDQVIEVEAWNHYCREPCIKDRVDCIESVLWIDCLLELLRVAFFITENEVIISGANSDCLIVGGPKEIIWSHI